MCQGARRRMRLAAAERPPPRCPRPSGAVAEPVGRPGSMLRVLAISGLSCRYLLAILAAEAHRNARRERSAAFLTRYASQDRLPLGNLTRLYTALSIPRRSAGRAGCTGTGKATPGND